MEMLDHTEGPSLPSMPGSRQLLSLTKPWLLPLTLLLAASVGALSAQPQEPEIWFDGPLEAQPSTTSVSPDADVDASGRTSVVWQASVDSRDVYFRRFAIDRTPLGDPVRANTTTAGPQTAPRVATSPSGTSLVVWISEEPGPIDPQGDDGFWIRSQFFDANGAASGAERFVSVLDATFSGGAHRPDVAALTDGRFVVVWRSATTSGNDGNTSIQGRLVSGSGVPMGDQFQINSTTSGSQNWPSVDALSDGGFVVAWSQPGVHLRRFQSTAAPIGADQQVNSSNSGERVQMVVGELYGSIVVVWKESSELWAKMFDSDLEPLTAAQMLNSPLDVSADDPVVADLGFEGFFFAWNGRDDTVDPDGSVQGRILQTSGAFSGPQFRINETIENDQNDPRLGSSNGRLAIVWRAASTPDKIAGYLSDYCALFCDDYELGTTERWSSVKSP